MTSRWTSEASSSPTVEVTPLPLKELKHEGRPLARFFFVQDPDGYRIEVLQRGGRFR